MSSEHLKVGIRIRPLLLSESLSEILAPEEKNSQIKILDGDNCISSIYDRVFESQSSQSEIYEFISPAVLQSLKGFNCTIFAYGQTGSGKTFTMFGQAWESNNPAPQIYFTSDSPFTQHKTFHPLHNPAGHGIIPRSISSIFAGDIPEKYSIYTSFLQIYNEKIYDLLQDSKKTKALSIRENKLYGVFVEGLAEYIVQNESDCFSLLAKGDANRAVRQTKLNHHSSRSHTVFQLLVETDKANKKGVLRKSKINFCDLAGSEKYDKENFMSAAHIREMTQINKSLSTLGKVIFELGKKKSLHIPYRDSKLTRLLQDSLGQTTRTILIATVSAAASCIDETINTLKFADRARQVLVKAKKNEVSAVSDEIVVKLQREINYLKGLLNIRNKGGIQDLHQQLLALQQENKKLKRIASGLSVEEVEMLKQENKRLRLELQSFGHVKESGDPYYKEEPTLSSSQSVLKVSDSSQLGYEEIESGATCPECRERIPCKHSVLGFPKINLSQVNMQQKKILKPIQSSLDITKKLQFRYKIKNQIVESDALQEEKKKDDYRKQLKAVKERLLRITQMEKTKKLKIMQDLERIEERKKKKHVNL